MFQVQTFGPLVTENCSCSLRVKMCGSVLRYVAELPQSVDGCHPQDLDRGDTAHFDCYRW